jgi:hypothetical protein
MRGPPAVLAMPDSFTGQPYKTYKPYKSRQGNPLAKAQWVKLFHVAMIAQNDMMKV